MPTLFSRRGLAASLAGIAVAAITTMPARAHHGWSWTSGGNIELTGVIVTADLGMPHGVLTVDVEGETWTVEIGQPWRNERAGIPEGGLAPGVEVRIEGEPSADPAERRIKAERIWLGGTLHDLYPERD